MVKKYKVIDSHAHIFPEKIAAKATVSISRFYGLEVRNLGTAKNLIALGEAANFKKYIVHSTATHAAQVNTINQFIKEECNIHPEFIGFGTLHPDLNSFTDEIELITQSGLAGIKIHPDFQNFDLCSPKSIDMFKAIEESGMPVLIHLGDPKSNNSRPYKLAKVLDTVPQLRVIGAHLGGYQRWEEGLDTLAGRNILIDTCSAISFLPKDMAKKIIAAFGYDHVVFGTDYPMWDPQEELTKFLSLGFSEDINEKILYTNILSFLGISHS